ncbi:kinase-like domain-containing protein [Obelidium mucronatum]|nr:kinase-like domain-containing protein [Obelidium mucronatum]
MTHKTVESPSLSGDIDTSTPQASLRLQRPPEPNIEDSLLRTVIKNRWMVTSSLGKGCYGRVYAARDMITCSTVAVKVEVIYKTSNNKITNYLQQEANILEKLIDCPQVVTILDSGVISNLSSVDGNVGNESGNDGHQIDDASLPQFQYIVMERLGQNISELRQKSTTGRFSIATTAVLGRQMLRAIQSVHEAGILHRDIKPGNFCMSVPNCQNSKTECKLIDFGLSVAYNKANGQYHDSLRKFRGTNRYASINAHLIKDGSRVDDLWSLFYSLLEFLIGTLPWKGKKDRDQVLALKSQQLTSLPTGLDAFFQVLCATMELPGTTPCYESLDACLLVLWDSRGSTKQLHEFDEIGDAFLFDWEFDGYGEIDIAGLRDAL